MQWADVTAPPSEKTLRQFAALWLIFFVSIGTWWALHQRHRFDVGLIGLGLVVGTLGMVRPGSVRWIYTGWLMAAFPLGWTISQGRTSAAPPGQRGNLLAAQAANPRGSRLLSPILI